jgi:phage regulator Rha-like protein
MVANKMTGTKGVLFTATYVTKFDEMEKQLKKLEPEDVMIAQLQEMKKMRLMVEQNKQVTKKLENRIGGMII